ncbi:unnamed protein product, partial [Prorocentrum cordatum]
APLPLAFADASLPRSPSAASVRASLHGVGVTEKCWDAAAVGAVGRASERGRYRGALRTNRRLRDLVEGGSAEPCWADVAGASGAQLRALGLQVALEEVPVDLARGGDWRVVAARRWRRRDKILAPEAEAALRQVRRDCAALPPLTDCESSLPRGGLAASALRPFAPALALDADWLGAGDAGGGFGGPSSAAAGARAGAAPRRDGRGRRSRRALARWRPGSALNEAERSGLASQQLGFNISSLAAAAVAPATQSNYLQALRRLLARLRAPRAPPLTAADWDLTLEQYVEFLHDRGLPEGDVASTLAAARWGLPHLPRPLRRGLPLATAAVTGWGRLEKPLSRPPAPRLVVILMALWLCERGQEDIGLFLLLTFETYMRPSEGLDLAGPQLAPPVPGEKGARQHWALPVRASELDVLGKTSEFDNSVALDLPRHYGSPLFFLISYVDLLQAWNTCIAALGLQHLQATPCSLRRRGASGDKASLSRPLLEIQKRGGCRPFQSARRCEKRARLSTSMRRVPQRLRDEARRPEPALERLLPPACER